MRQSPLLDDVAGGEAVPVVPVVIVGGGPVGVMSALLLARRGIRSVILERHRGVYPLPRAVATDDETRRILQAAGIDEEFARISRPGNGMRLLDSRHRIIAEFRRSEHGFHGFPQTSLFDQPELEQLLRARLARYEECELRDGVEVLAVEQSGDRAAARVLFRREGSEGSEAVECLDADAVLGCDGANSVTRESIGARWEDLGFEETWTVVDVRTRAEVRCWEGVDQVCHSDRPATFMRVGEDRYRWEFRLRTDESLEGPSGQELLDELMAPWLRAGRGDGFEVLRKAEYTFRARVAERWRSGRIFVLGDAAHLTPPFIGQGLCSGLRDAYNLSWKLARVLQEGADEALLDTYEAERKPHARHVIRLAVAAGWAMTGGQDRAAALRRTAVSLACRLPAVTRAASRDLSPALVSGRLVRRTSLPGRRLAGTHCPQPFVGSDGLQLRLDELLGDGFTVLTAGEPGPAVTAVSQALHARIIDVTSLKDDGVLGRWLRTGGADAALVRPDRVVADIVPAGADSFTDTAAWAPLLCTTRRPAVRSLTHVAV